MDAWGYHHGAGYGYNDIWGFIMMLFLFAVIALGLYFAIKSASPSQATKPEEDEALVLLKKRYVAGEIDTKEYNEKKKVITS